MASRFEPERVGADGIDVLIVSLGATGGLRAADEELLASLRRAGASAAIVRARPPRAGAHADAHRPALGARGAAAARAELARTAARAVIYSTTTAALLWPRPGAIRFDAPAAANRPGRHGLWQRPLERRRLRGAPLLLPLSEGALLEVPPAVRDARVTALVLPVPVDPSGSARGMRDIAAHRIYVANPAKKGLDRILRAWSQARGARRGAPRGRRVPRGAEQARLRVARRGSAGRLDAAPARTTARCCAARACSCARLVARTTAMAQLEALADGCMLVTTPSPGPYAALPIARALDARLVDDDLAGAIRTALDDPRGGLRRACAGRAHAISSRRGRQDRRRAATAALACVASENSAHVRVLATS